MAAGGDPGWTPSIPRAPGLVPTPTGSIRLDPVPGIEGYWLETAVADEGASRETAARVTPVVAALLDAERQRGFLAEELATRYEEIDLLYAISEILGRTTRLDEAAETIVREVSTVVGARRASIMVYDETTGRLRTVAARGFTTDALVPVSPDDEGSVAARAFPRLTVIVDAVNASDREVDAVLRSTIDGIHVSQPVKLAPREQRTIRMTPGEHAELILRSPRLWWPYRLGAPDLYTAHLEIWVDGVVSDSQQSTFGVRDVTSELTTAGHRLFKVKRSVGF